MSSSRATASKNRKRSNEKISAVVEETPVKKRTCTEGVVEEPDVTVVVGGVEFQEYRQVLCCLYSYFDRAFRSGMQEAKSKRFSFPERDPAEWEIIMSVLGPGSPGKPTADNIDVVVSWSDVLCIQRLPYICDLVFKEKVLSTLVPFNPETTGRDLTLEEKKDLRNHLPSIMVALEQSIRTRMDTSKGTLFSALRRILTSAPEVFTLETVSTLLASLREREYYDMLHSHVAIYIPEGLLNPNPNQNNNIDQLLQNDALPHVVHSQMQMQYMKKKCLGMIPELLSVIPDSNNSIYYNSDKVRKFRSIKRKNEGEWAYFDEQTGISKRPEDEVVQVD